MRNRDTKKHEMNPPLRNFEIPFKDIEIVKEIGKGAYGKVFEGVWQNVKVAVKKMHDTRGKFLLHDQIMEKQLKREFHILHSLPNHPNVVKFYGYSRDNDGVLYLVSELGDMSLYEMIDRLSRGECVLSKDEKMKLVLHVALGLKFLHLRQKIVHRDCRPSNVVLFKQQNGEHVAKLCDFGLAARLVEGRKITSNPSIGASFYVSPELIGGEQPSPASDIFSFGVLFYSFFIERHPSSGFMESIGKVEKKIKILIEKCIRKKKEDRIGVGDIVDNIIEVLRLVSIKKIKESKDKIGNGNPGRKLWKPKIQEILTELKKVWGSVCMKVSVSRLLSVPLFIVLIVATYLILRPSRVRIPVKGSGASLHGDCLKLSKFEVSAVYARRSWGSWVIVDYEISEKFSFGEIKGCDKYYCKTHVSVLKSGETCGAHHELPEGTSIGYLEVSFEGTWWRPIATKDCSFHTSHGNGLADKQCSVQNNKVISVRIQPKRCHNYKADCENWGTVDFKDSFRLKYSVF